MDGRHLVVSYNLSFDNKNIQTYLLIDCGARGYALVDETFVTTNKLPRFPLRTPRGLEVIDG
jgi:hypothetical protein